MEVRENLLDDYARGSCNQLRETEPSRTHAGDNHLVCDGQIKPVFCTLVSVC